MADMDWGAVFGPFRPKMAPFLPGPVSGRSKGVILGLF